jgi:5-methyltetrahydrofolate--homocysteine methyltransferase
MGEVLEAIQASVREGDQRSAVAFVREALDAGLPAQRILADGLIPGMQQLGLRFRDGQAFLPEILVSSRAMSHGLEELRPHLEGGAAEQRGTVVLGTVEGDLHDIGKKLVAMLLSGNGFAVVDLGVDVAPEAFITAARENDADIVALSALLTTTTPQFSRIIAAFMDAGLRESVMVMVGGAPVTAELAADVGADGFAPDCVAAVDEAARLVSAKRG